MNFRPSDLRRADIPFLAVVERLDLIPNNGRVMRCDSRDRIWRECGPWCLLKPLESCDCSEVCAYTLFPHMHRYTRPDGSEYLALPDHEEPQHEPLQEPPAGSQRGTETRESEIPYRLQVYLQKEFFLHTLTKVIDTFLNKPQWLYEYPSQDAVTAQKYRDLWPDKNQPHRRQLYALLRHHQIDYKALVTARKAAVLVSEI